MSSSIELTRSSSIGLINNNGAYQAQRQSITAIKESLWQANGETPDCNYCARPRSATMLWITSFWHSISCYMSGPLLWRAPKLNALNHWAQLQWMELCRYLLNTARAFCHSTPYAETLTKIESETDITVATCQTPAFASRRDARKTLRSLWAQWYFGQLTR